MIVKENANHSESPRDNTDTPAASNDTMPFFPLKNFKDHIFSNHRNENLLEGVSQGFGLEKRYCSQTIFNSSTALKRHIQTQNLVQIVVIRSRI
jgi:hypothetical protein